MPEIPENTPSRPAVDKLLVAGRLNGILTLVIFMAGLLLFLMQKWFLASVLMVLGSFSMASTYLLWSRWRNRQKIAALPVAEDPPSQSSTIVWRPYRSASAELNSNFLKQLDAIIEELIRTAQQDKWAVNWNKSDATLIEARTAARKKSSKEALQKYAEVIQRFMTALKKHRSGE